MQRAVDHLGRLIFRWRSVLPLALVWVGMSVTWDSHLQTGPGGQRVDEVLNVVGITLCFLGSVWRLVTVASVPAGSSTQTRLMKTNALNTTGMYSVVRHPLYVGNFFITVGLLLVVHEPWAYALGLLYWVVTHALIVRREEKLLSLAFPVEFRQFVETTPKWFPKWSRLSSVKGPFAWKRAMQREVNPLVAWGCGADALLAWERFVRSQMHPPEAKQDLAVLVLLLVLLAVNKVWKKRQPA